jgi:hypothetical protein
LANKVFLAFLSIFVFCTASRAQVKKALFIGNSMTYYNDMPSIVSNFGEANQMLIERTVSAFPGRSLYRHCNNHDENDPKNCKLNYNLDDFDFVILQEANFLITSDIKKLNDKYLINALSIQCNPQKTKLVFQEPFTCLTDYPHQRIPIVVKDSVYEGDWINDKQAELKHYKDFTKTLLSENICGVAKIGSCFDFLSNSNPKIQLIDEESHPTKLGSIIIAFIIFKNISQSEFPDIPEEYRIHQKEIIVVNGFLNK